MISRDKSKIRKKIFIRDDKINDRLLPDLTDACRGLTFISETDADIKAFIAGIPRSRSLRSYLETLDIEDRNVEEVGFGDFFARLTAEKDWHGPMEKIRSKRFADLRDVLEKNVDGLRVIRAGRIRIDIYITGVDADGRLAGVKTQAMET